MTISKVLIIFLLLSLPPIVMARQYTALVANAAKQHAVPESLIHAVIKTESNYRAAVISSAGAVGLMQLMPATAKRFGVSNRKDPAQNINAGVRYLRWLLDRYQWDLHKSLAAYNAGEGAVDKYKGIPPYKETRNYVKRVLKRYGNGSTVRSAALAKQSAPIAIGDSVRPGVVRIKSYGQQTQTVATAKAQHPGHSGAISYVWSD